MPPVNVAPVDRRNRYDNTTDHDVDAMAQIDLYFHPKGNVSITYPVGPVSQ